jgi:hypothetical protein
MKKIREMKINYLVICSIVFLLFAAGQAIAATYYVSPTGSDSSSGTSSAPFRTIQKAANIVNAGDTVIVKNGTYTDTNSDKMVVYLNRGGTSGHPVTFRSENKWGAIVDGQNNTTGYCWSLGTNARYVNIESFEIKGCANMGIASTSGADYISITGNSIHNIGRRETTSAYGQAGIFVGGGTNYYVIDSNLIYSNGRLNPNTTPSATEASCGSTCYGHDHGIYAYGANHTIINNIFYDHKSGWAIQVTGGSGSDGPNWDIVNNTFYGMNPRKDGQIVIWTSGGNMVTNVLLQNNISYGSRNVFVHSLVSGSSTWQLKNNRVYGATKLINKATGGIPTYTSSGNITGKDP